MTVPLACPWITNSDKKAILNSLKTPQLTDGPKLREFESRFAKYVESRFAIGVSNGTAALHLSLVSAGIGVGDEVIIPDMTFIATANSVILSKAKPVPVDIDSSLNISPDLIEDKITRKTRAIMPVHFAGYPCNMDKIREIASKYNLKIIEDAAHALGTRYRGKHVGLFGDAGCFSFYPAKNLTTIEGGMIITDSEKIAKKAGSLRNHGLTKTLIQRDKNPMPWIYDIIEPGYNYRLDEVRASLGLSQLERIDKITKKRIRAAEYYHRHLSKIDGIDIVNYPNYQGHVYHLYIIRIKKKFGISRDTVHVKLNKLGIRTTVHYKPIHQFSYFTRLKLRDKQFPNSVLAYRECLTLPMFTTITKEQQDYVMEGLLSLKN